MPLKGRKRMAFGRHRLTDRQIEVLLLYHRLKRPTMNQVARELGISKNGLMSTLYPLVKRGYMEQTAIARWSSYRLTPEKGVPYVKTKLVRMARTKRKAKATTTRLRNKFIYTMRQEGHTWKRIAWMLERRPPYWPLIVSREAMKKAAEAHAKRLEEIRL